MLTAHFTDRAQKLDVPDVGRFADNQLVNLILPLDFFLPKQLQQLRLNGLGPSTLLL